MHEIRPVGAEFRAHGRVDKQELDRHDEVQSRYKMAKIKSKQFLPFCNFGSTQRGCLTSKFRVFFAILRKAPENVSNLNKQDASFEIFK